MREIISMTTTYKNGGKESGTWYDNESALPEDVFKTEEELRDYLLESINSYPDFEYAILFEAESLVMDGSKEIRRIRTTIDRR